MVTKINKKSNKVTPKTNLDFDIWVLLDQTRDIISKARELELDQYKLTRVQATVLFMLINHDRGVTLAEISKWILREPHSVSSLINRMEKTGLVKKIKSLEAPKINVVLTDKGRELYSNASQQSIDMIFSSLSSEEKLRFKSELKKLRDKARNLLGMDYKPPFLP